MTSNKEQGNKIVAPWTRIIILLVALASALLISYIFTGTILPSSSKDALVLQNALLLVVLGSALLEHHFTKPADSVVNSLMGAITLVSVYTVAPRTPWLLVFCYCLFVFTFSIICVTSSSGKNITGWRKTVSDVTYKASVVLGRAKLLYSIIFLFGLYAFYKIQSPHTIALVIFWGLFIVIWPLGLPQFLSSFTKRDNKVNQKSGKLIRTDSPGLLRFSITPTTKWKHNVPHIYQRADGVQNWVLPLYSHIQNENLIGTALTLGRVEEPLNRLENGFVYGVKANFAPDNSTIMSYFGEKSNARLTGFIIEGSEISQIQFELWDDTICKAGMLVWCKMGKTTVYYQVTNGSTREENLETDRHGFQVAVAAQLGILSEKKGFKKYDWLPCMNTPIFSALDGKRERPHETPNTDFRYGVIPNSNINVTGHFTGTFDHHTAILGITGSGKTELAFDMIRHSLDNDMKVICIDLTSQYESRLSDLSPTNLSITKQLAEALSKKIFDVETGTYGAPNEKKILNSFACDIRKDISDKIKDFFESQASSKEIGLIKLEEISNTQATLWITELYLTCLLNYAKEHLEERQKILLVVEEAHTVMPEPSTMGLGDFSSKGLVGKISQIALQGRKYGVGLLVLAQRTATVSKTILTQCNTIISFTTYDDTSLGFLKNIFGEGHVKVIPNLKPLQAIAFGKAIRTDRPVLIEIPYDENKASINA